jgi:hypothetical protein
MSTYLAVDLSSVIHLIELGERVALSNEFVPLSKDKNPTHWILFHVKNALASDSCQIMLRVVTKLPSMPPPVDIGSPRVASKDMLGVISPR